MHTKSNGEDKMSPPLRTAEKLAEEFGVLLSQKCKYSYISKNAKMAH